MAGVCDIPAGLHWFDVSPGGPLFLNGKVDNSRLLGKWAKAINGIVKVD